MRTRRGVATALTLLLLGLAPAEASPITGGFSIAGNFLPVNGQTGASSLLGMGYGSFSGMQGSFVTTVSDFSFAGPGSASFLIVPVALFALPSFNNLTFTLNSVSLGAGGQSNSALSLVGQGIFALTGYTNTAGTFNVTANGAGGTFPFSGSNGVQVPEPASLALLGGGLLVGAATLNRRRRRANQ